MIKNFKGLLFFDEGEIIVDQVISEMSIGSEVKESLLPSFLNGTFLRTCK